MKIRLSRLDRIINILPDINEYNGRRIEFPYIGDGIKELAFNKVFKVDNEGITTGGYEWEMEIIPFD